MITRAARIFRGEKRRAPPAADIARFLDAVDLVAQIADPASARVIAWLRLLAGDTK